MNTHKKKDIFQQISNEQANFYIQEKLSSQQREKQEQQEKGREKAFFAEYPELHQYELYLRKADLLHKDCIYGEGAFNYVLKSEDVAIKMPKNGVDIVKLIHEADINNGFWERRKKLIQKGNLPEEFRVPDVYRIPTAKHPFYEMEGIDGQNVYSSYLIHQMGNPVGMDLMKDKEVEELYIRTSAYARAQNKIKEPGITPKMGEFLERFLVYIPRIPAKHIEELLKEQDKERKGLEMRPLLKNLDTTGILTDFQKRVFEEANMLFKTQGISQRDWHAKNMMKYRDNVRFGITDFGQGAYITYKDHNEIIYQDPDLLYDMQQLSIEEINTVFNQQRKSAIPGEKTLLNVIYPLLEGKKMTKEDWKHHVVDNPSLSFALKNTRQGKVLSIAEITGISYSNILFVLEELKKK